MPTGRFTFALFGNSLGLAQSGVAVQVKDERTGTFIASTSPVNDQLMIHDNNDGAYFMDGWTMSIFSVYAGSDVVPQEEMMYQVPGNSQLLDHMEATSGEHGATGQLLGGGDVIDNLTSNDTDKPLSAKQGKTLEDGKADSSHSHAEADISDLDKYTQSEVNTLLNDKIVESVDANDLEVDAGGELKLIDRNLLGSADYLNDSNSLLKNIFDLAVQLKSVSESQGGLDRRVVFVDSTSEILTGQEAAALPVYSELGNAYKVKRRFTFMKRSGDTKLILTFKGHVTQ